jgi:chorismate dehydratase
VNPPTRVRLGAVSYLNARPLVYGLDRSPRFSVRYDTPSECARLLHGGAIDVGLIPSIEYLRGGPYHIVPDLAIASRGKVASVVLYTTKPMADVRSIAMDTSSRTSVALVKVLCARRFKIRPVFEAREPDLAQMLAHSDAALIIGDKALFLHDSSDISDISDISSRGGRATIETLDLGEIWTDMTKLPFVYAFWAGRGDALQGDDVAALLSARDEGVRRPEELARTYLAAFPDRQKAGADYLRDNIKYHLGGDERAGLEAFYRYAAEAGAAPERSGRADLRFF